MKEIYVLTWDTEYEGLLHSYKAYTSRKAAEDAVEEYISAFNEEKQKMFREGILTTPQIHKLEVCL